MGLGKTLQAISLLSYLKVSRNLSGPFREFSWPFSFSSRSLDCKVLQCPDWLKYWLLSIVLLWWPAVVLCPLSVSDGWVSEVMNFAPKLRVLRYVGEREHRCGLRKMIYDHMKEHCPMDDVSSENPLKIPFPPFTIHITYPFFFVSRSLMWRVVAWLFCRSYHFLLMFCWRHTTLY